MFEFTEFQPKDTVVKSLVDRYVLVKSHGKNEVVTLPNGRVDGVIILKGGGEWFFPSANQFKRLPACTFYPLTSKQNRARSKASLTCISIKFFPHVLGLPCFKEIKMVEPVSFETVFGPWDERGFIQEINASQKKSIDFGAMTSVLDSFFKEKLIDSGHHAWMAPIIHMLEKAGGTNIERIAKAQGMTIKTFERKFTSLVGLSPKLFARIVQLQHAARNILAKGTKNQHGNLIEALGSGYYDQAHFIKSCKKIMGMTPKKLFKQMPKEMTDLMVLE